MDRDELDALKPIDLSKAEADRDDVKARRSFMRRYWLFFGIAGFLVLTLFIYRLYTAPVVHADKITDVAYEHQANAVCATYMTRLQAQQQQQGDQSSNIALINRVKNTAATMQALRDRLNAISVKTADQVAVSSWLHQWDLYISTGYSYATALGSNNKNEWMKVGSEGDTYSRNITTFAYVNKMSNCELKTQQPPATGV